MDSIENVTPLLETPKDVVIFTHRNPDGDAIGSSLGLAHFLQQQGHTVAIIAPSDYPDFLSFLPGVDRIIIYDNDPDRAQEVVERSNLVFLLDFNSLDRIDKVGNLLNDRVPRIMIDHHLFPEPCADHIFSDTTASSTCEMVFDFIKALGKQHLIDQRIGDCLFTGILTDTGSFRYSTSPKLFRTVAELIEAGVDEYKIQDLIFNSQTEKQLRLLGHCLYNRMEVLPELHTGIIWLTKEDYAKFDIQRGDTEGVVNFILRMRNVMMAAFIHEQPTIVKLSLRSKGDLDVQEIAKRNFRGGGHKNAAGGASFQNLRVTLRRFKKILPEYADTIREAYDKFHQL
jgi:phosphoesterase RecJ-like protein